METTDLATTKDDSGPSRQKYFKGNFFLLNNCFANLNVLTESCTKVSFKYIQVFLKYF